MSFERATDATSRADQTTVRRANLGVVLQQIAAGEPRSRARVAAETGLTRGTVSSLVGELIELGLLRETGEGDRSGRVGRPAQTLELGDRVVAVGLEVNVDYLAVCVEDLTGDGPSRAAACTPTTGARARPGARAGLRGWPRRRSTRSRPPGSSRSASPSRFPGLVEAQTGTLLRAPNLGWSGIAVADELAARLSGLPMRADNEANLAALAEHWQGVAQDLENFICVFGEVGVGGGIFVDGELFRGAHGFGGEFGHVTVDPDGPSLQCGSRGCLETFVGQEAIARRAGLCVGAGEPRPEHHARARATRRAGEPAVIGEPRGGRPLPRHRARLGGQPLRRRRRRARRVLRAARPLARRRRPRHARESVSSPRPGRGCEVRASEFGERAAVRGAAALTLTVRARRAVARRASVRPSARAS